MNPLLTKIELGKGYYVLLEKNMLNKLEEVIKLGQLAKKHKYEVFMI